MGGDCDGVSKKPWHHCQNVQIPTKGPSTKIAPNWFFKFLSMFDREAKGMLALLGINMTADNSDTIKTFSWTPIPFEKTVIETANSIKMIQTK